MLEKAAFIFNLIKKGGMMSDFDIVQKIKRRLRGNKQEGLVPDPIKYRPRPRSCCQAPRKNNKTRHHKHQKPANSEK